MSALRWVTYVHSYVAADWRSGVQREDNTELLRDGPFACSRNPMFLGIFVAQIGFFLALPSLFALACLIIGSSCLILQARFKEMALARRHGKVYLDYLNATPRWLPRLRARAA